MIIPESQATIKLAWPHDAPNMAVFDGQRRVASYTKPTPVAKRHVVAWYTAEQFVIIIGMFAPE